MLIRTKPTTLLQIFCKIILNFVVTIKITQVPGDNFKRIFLSINGLRKIFDGEVLIRTKPTTLLQIFCKIILYFKVIVKIIKDPDDNFCRNGSWKSCWLLGRGFIGSRLNYSCFCKATSQCSSGKSQTNFTDISEILYGILPSESQNRLRDSVHCSQLFTDGMTGEGRIIE